ncbi:PspC domain-containing protein [bacterium]|nr:PspC domain-containing protein [bacterium]
MISTQPYFDFCVYRTESNLFEFEVPAKQMDNYMAEESKGSPKGRQTKPTKRSTRKESTSEARTEKKRIYRSKSNRMIGGVCSGLSQYIGVDSTIVRVVWAFAVLWGGVGLLAYILCWIIVPENPSEEDAVKADDKKNSGLVWGIILLGVGCLFLAREFDWYDFHPIHFRWHFMRGWPGYYGFDLLWPILIIAVGVIYLVYAWKKGKDQSQKEAKSAGGKSMDKKLTRSVKDRMIGGVCGGVAEYFSIDPSIVRVLWAILTLAGGGLLGILAYVVMLIVVPEESAVETPGPAPKTAARKTKK